MTPDSTASTEIDLEGREKLISVITVRDIVFNCPACQSELVVDRAGEGIEVPCPHCGQSLTVPAFQAQAAGVSSVATPPEVPARTFDFSASSPEQLQRRLGELKHQLKENRSQDTEMRGHVNRATIELHRLQLRLKTLQERHADIEAELAAIQARQVTSAS